MRSTSAILPTVLLFLAGVACPATTVEASQPNIIEINARRQPKTPPVPLPGMGGASPDGHTIGVNSLYLTLDGKPWLPVMGEFHYTRYPEQYWEEELLKMKAGGVQIVSTYVFWIHHEEIEGEFDWSGRRNLRRFVELCKKDGLYVFLRIGPYAHGEVRNGGLPDWVVAAGDTRRNNARYLASVQRYFGQIADQVRGLLWKDGGPIIDIQLENEYSLRGSDAGIAHILELKKLSREAGLIAPMYTVTGWDNAAYPAGEVVPVFGGYVDNFWDSSLNDLPPAGYYLFEPLHAADDKGSENNTPPVAYPFFLAEAGGGMQVAYHRRPIISGDDVAAMTLTRLGSGANLYGYYMFHGGSNPDGKLTSLQESVETDHVYDLPKVSYDFQAPLGEYGQTNPPFRATKLFHLFLNDFGADLAPMVTVLPKSAPTNPNDLQAVRAAARVNGNRAFVFVNNYQRLYPLADHGSVQFRLALPSETILLPRKPAKIPSGAYFVWPVNFDLNGILLKYATAQLLTKISTPARDYYFFVAQPGIAAEFVFDGNTVTSIHAQHAAISRHDEQLSVTNLIPGKRGCISVQSKTGRPIGIFLLSLEDAKNAWKWERGGKQYLVISPADVFFSPETCILRSRDPDIRLSIFPKAVAISPGPALRRESNNSLFAAYRVRAPRLQVRTTWQKIRDPESPRPPKIGKYNAVAPDDKEFEHAGVWHVSIPPIHRAGLSDLFLQVKYFGDVARLYAGQHLLDDDFFKGTTWEIGLKRFLPELADRPAILKILPLQKDAPIYLPRNVKSMLAIGEKAGVLSIAVVPEYELRISISGEH